MDKEERVEPDADRAETVPVSVEPRDPSGTERRERFWDKAGTWLVIAGLVAFVLFLSKGRLGGSS